MRTTGPSEVPAACGTSDIRTKVGLVSRYLLRFCWLRLPLRLMSGAGGAEPGPAGQAL